MIDDIDYKYANILSSRFDRTKIISHAPLKINFRCPICNDSSKNRTKARGWILQLEETMRFYCHNCNASLSFKSFLKGIDNNLYGDYVSEKFFNKDKKDTINSLFANAKTNEKTLETSINAYEDIHLDKIKKISDMPDTHPAKEYVHKRKIPKNRINDLYYAPKFKNWVNTMIPDKFILYDKNGNKKPDEPRLIIPFKDLHGVMFGFAARSFDPKAELRYISIMLDPKQSKFFGLDKVDFKKTYYVVEGAIDSFHVKNSIAMAGADANVKVLENKDNMVIVYDNEPRNKEIVNRMKSDINKGYKVALWPSSIEEKDINSMVVSGKYTETDIEKILKDNTYQGLNAEIQLNMWKRI